MPAPEIAPVVGTLNLSVFSRPRRSHRQHARNVWRNVPTNLKKAIVNRFAKTALTLSGASKRFMCRGERFTQAGGAVSGAQLRYFLPAGL